MEIEGGDGFIAFACSKGPLIDEPNQVGVSAWSCADSVATEAFGCFPNASVTSQSFTFWKVNASNSEGISWIVSSCTHVM